MFYNEWMLSQLAKEHRRDLMQRLEHDRLIHEAERANHPQRHTLYHALDWAGRQLVRWGERLQARHAMYHRQTVTRTIGG